MYIRDPIPKEKAAAKVTPPAQMFVLHLVLQKPGIYLHEIQKEVEATLLVDVSLSTLCTFLHKSVSLINGWEQLLCNKMQCWESSLAQRSLCMPLSCSSLLMRLGLMLGTSKEDMAIVYVEKSSTFRQRETCLSNRMHVLSWIIGCADL